LGGQNTQVFTLKLAARTVQLAPGRYMVRVEYRGEVKEREIDLTGAQRSLTFSAEFKVKE
jgi:hypothetical protein